MNLVTVEFTTFDDGFLSMMVVATRQSAGQSKRTQRYPAPSQVRTVLHASRYQVLRDATGKPSGLPLVSLN